MIAFLLIGRFNITMSRLITGRGNHGKIMVNFVRGCLWFFMIPLAFPSVIPDKLLQVALLEKVLYQPFV